MKAFNTKKFLRCAVFSLMICTVLVIGFAMNALYATAHETDEFTFVGASVRLDKEGETSGLRFTADFGSSLYEKLVADGQYRSDSAELGMIIVPDSYIKEYETSGYDDYFTFFSEVKGKTKSQISTQFAVEQMVNVAEATYRISGALVNIKYANYEREFRPIAYYTENGADYYYQAGTEPKSISSMSISAIEKDQNELSLTDKELDILYKYADGWIPRTIYDASRGEHISKLLNMPILIDGESRWTAMRETVSIDGVDYFKISAETLGESSTIAISYVLPDDFDISNYDFVSFSATYNRDGIRIGLCDTQSPGLNEDGAWSTTEANIPNNAAMGVNYFIEQANGGKYSLTAKLLQPDDACLISDFVAYGKKCIEKMISTLPTEGFLTREEKNTVDELTRVFDAAQMIYNNYTQKISNYDRYLTAMNLPHALHDASYEPDSDAIQLLGIPEEETPYRAEVTQVVYGGYEFFKLTVLEKGSSDIIPFTFNSHNVNCDIYSYIYFGIYTEVDGAAMAIAQTANPAEYSPSETLSKYSINPLYGEPELLPNSDYEYCFGVVGLEAGESIYFTDFTLFNKDSVRMLVEALPSPNDVTEADRESIELAKLFYDLLDNTNANVTVEKTYADPDGKLQECVDALLLLPYPIVGYHKTNAESIFTHIDELYGVQCDEFTVEKDAVYGKDLFKFTTTKVNDALGEHAIIANLQSLGLSVGTREFDYIIFDVRIENHRSFLYETDNENDVTVALGYAAADGMYLIDVIQFEQTGPNTGIVIIDGSILKEHSFNDLFFGILNSELGESVWISSILGITKDQLKAMIDTLPAPAEITEADRAEFDRIYHYCQHIAVIASQDDYYYIDPDEKLESCKRALERLPYLIHPQDVTHPETYLKHEQIIGDGESAMEFTTLEDGTIMCKVVKLGSMNSIALSYSTSGLYLSAYDFVSLDVITTGTGLNGIPVEGNILHRNLESIGGWAGFQANVKSPVMVGREQLVSNSEEALLVLRNLKVGDIIYISPFTAYNKDAMNSMIRSLPVREGRTVKDIEKLEKIYTLMAISGYSENDIDTASIELFNKLPMIVYDTSDPEELERFIEKKSSNYTLESVNINGYSWMKLTANEGVTETDRLLLKIMPKDIPYCDDDSDIFFRFMAEGVADENKYIAELYLAPDTDTSSNIDGFHIRISNEQAGYALPKSDFYDTLNYGTLAFSGITAGESVYISSSIVADKEVTDASGVITEPGMIHRLIETLPDTYFVGKDDLSKIEFISTIFNAYGYQFSDDYALKLLLSLLTLPEIIADMSVPSGLSCIEIIEDSCNGMPAGNVEVYQYASGNDGWIQIKKTDDPQNTAPIFININIDNTALEGKNTSEYYVVFRIKTDASFDKHYGDEGVDYAALVSLVEKDATTLDGKTNTTLIHGGSNERVCVFKCDEFMSDAQHMTGVFEGIAPGESVYISDFGVYTAEQLSVKDQLLPALEQITADDVDAMRYYYALAYCLSDIADDPQTTENEAAEAAELKAKISARFAAAITASLPDVDTIDHQNATSEQRAMMYELNETVRESDLSDEMRADMLRYVYKYLILTLPELESIDSAEHLSQYHITTISNLHSNSTFSETATANMKAQAEAYYAKLTEYGLV